MVWVRERVRVYLRHNIIRNSSNTRDGTVLVLGTRVLGPEYKGVKSVI